MAPRLSVNQKPVVRNRQRTMLRYAVAGVTVSASVAVGAYVVFSGMNADDASARKSKSKANYDYVVCPGQRIQLDSFEGDIYRWTPAEGLSNPEAKQPFATPNKTTVYSATVYTKLDTVLSVVNSSLNAANGLVFEKQFTASAYDSYNVVLAAHSESGEKLDLQLRINGISVLRMDATTNTQSATAIWDNIDENKAMVELQIVAPRDYNGSLVIDNFYVVLLGKETLLTQVYVDKGCVISASNN